MVCDICHVQTCLWMRYCDEIIAHGDWYYDNEAPEVNKESETRKFCYRMFICIHYGPLGVGVRVELPQCVVEGVREVYPSPDNTYMGYMSS